MDMLFSTESLQRAREQIAARCNELDAQNKPLPTYLERGKLFEGAAMLAERMRKKLPELLNAIG